MFKIVKTFDAGLEASITHLMHSSAIRYLDNFPPRSGNQEIQRESTLLSGSGDNNPQSSLRDDLSQPKPCEEVSAVNSTDVECFFRDDDVSWFFDSDLHANNETVLKKTTSNALSSESFNLEESYKKMAQQEISFGNDGHLGRGEEGLCQGCTEERADSVNDEDFEDCFSGIPLVSASQRNHPCSSFESSLNHDPLTINDCKLLSWTRDFGSRISCLQKDVAKIGFAESYARDHGSSLESRSLCSAESRALRESGSGTKACHLMGCDGLLEPDGLEDIIGIDWRELSFGGITEDMTEFEDDDVATGSRLSCGVIDSGCTAADDPPPNKYSRHLVISSCDRNAKCPNSSSVEQSSECGFARLFSPVQTSPSFSDGENTGVQERNHSPLINFSNSSMSLSQWLTELGSRLSHGADDMMKLVVEMAHGQLVRDTSNRSRPVILLYMSFLAIYFLFYFLFFSPVSGLCSVAKKKM